MPMTYELDGRILVGKADLEHGFRVRMTIDPDDGSISFRSRGDGEERWLSITASKLSVDGMREIAKTAAAILTPECLLWFEEGIVQLQAATLLTESDWR